MCQCAVDETVFYFSKSVISEKPLNHPKPLKKKPKWPLEYLKLG